MLSELVQDIKDAMPYIKFGWNSVISMKDNLQNSDDHNFTTCKNLDNIKTRLRSYDVSYEYGWCPVVYCILQFLHKYEKFPEKAQEMRPHEYRAPSPD